MTKKIEEENNYNHWSKWSIKLKIAKVITLMNFNLYQKKKNVTAINGGYFDNYQAN